jgi:hypothetical protein
MFKKLFIPLLPSAFDEDLVLRLCWLYRFFINVNLILTNLNKITIIYKKNSYLIYSITQMIRFNRKNQL